MVSPQLPPAVHSVLLLVLLASCQLHSSYPTLTSSYGLLLFFFSTIQSLRH